MSAPRIEGFGHIELTVTDGQRSMRWWTEVLGFRLLATYGRAGYRVWSMNHPSGVPVSLIVHDEGSGGSFDERVVGLDHFALKVRDRPTLEGWAKHLDEHGVPHSGIQEENGGPLIVLRDPDNIQVELWAFDPDLVELGKPTDRDVFFVYHGPTSK
jgi:catechol 2,3-dioxygenase-like lactoylglutathione lyase family enzyme